MKKLLIILIALASIIEAYGQGGNPTLLYNDDGSIQILPAGQHAGKLTIRSLTGGGTQVYSNAFNNFTGPSNTFTGPVYINSTLYVGTISNWTASVTNLVLQGTANGNGYAFTNLGGISTAGYATLNNATLLLTNTSQVAQWHGPGGATATLWNPYLNMYVTNSGAFVGSIGDRLNSGITLAGTIAGGNSISAGANGIQLIADPTKVVSIQGYPVNFQASLVTNVGSLYATTIDTTGNIGSDAVVSGSIFSSSSYIRAGGTASIWWNGGAGLKSTDGNTVKVIQIDSVVSNPATNGVMVARSFLACTTTNCLPNQSIVSVTTNGIYITPATIGGAPIYYGGVTPKGGDYKIARGINGFSTNLYSMYYDGTSWGTNNWRQDGYGYAHIGNLASSNAATVMIGNRPDAFPGLNTPKLGFQGNASGTMIGANYVTDGGARMPAEFLNFQTNGVSVFMVYSNGTVVATSGAQATFTTFNGNVIAPANVRAIQLLQTSTGVGGGLGTLSSVTSEGSQGFPYAGIVSPSNSLKSVGVPITDTATNWVPYAAACSGNVLIYSGVTSVSNDVNAVSLGASMGASTNTMGCFMAVDGDDLNQSVWGYATGEKSAGAIDLNTMFMQQRKGVNNLRMSRGGIRQEAAGSSNLLAGTTYVTGALKVSSGWNGVVTNMVSLTTTNYMYYGSGVLTNVVTLP